MILSENPKYSKMHCVFLAWMLRSSQSPKKLFMSWSIVSCTDWQFNDGLDNLMTEYLTL